MKAEWMGNQEPVIPVDQKGKLILSPELKERLDALEAENRRLRVEVDVLKRALGFKFTPDGVTRLPYIKTIISMCEVTDEEAKVLGGSE